MGWKDWDYRNRGLIAGIFLWIILYLVRYYLTRNYAIFTEGNLITGFLSLLFCFFVAWTIKVVKNKSSSTKKGLFYGLVVSMLSLSFMFFEGYFNIYGIGQQVYIAHAFSNFVINFGYLWMSIPILLFTLIGFIIDKVKSRTDKSREIFYSVISAIVLLIIIFGLYGVGSFFYGNNPSKCEYYSDKDSCYSEVALNLVNKGRLQKSLCESIQRDTLKFKCYIQLAGQNKDLQVCENISYLPTKDKCIANVAVVQNDASICDKAQTEFKTECLRWVSQGSSSY